LRIGETIRSYIWWTHPRGGFHYDVMVTVILAFIFLTPSSVFKDKTIPQRGAGQILVTPDGQSGFIYEVGASAVRPGESDVQSALKSAIAPVAGPVEISHYEEVHVGSGKLTGYRVWAHRQ
jgi:hypothetical protein